MFTTQKRTLIALSVLFAISAAFAKPISSTGLVLNLRNGPDTLRLKDSGPFKNIGKGTSAVISNSPSLVSMKDTHQLSISVWIRPKSIPHEFPVIVSKGAHNTSGPTGGYELTLNSNGDNDIVFYSGNFYAYTGAANGTLVNQHLGEWIHIAVTIDADAQIAQIYVNGQAYSNIVLYGTFADVNFDAPYDLYVGTGDPGGAAAMATFDGTIQQLRIYNRALSGDEVQNLFATTKPK